ncbi:MAG: diguanylate cyclase [Gammaproteobacteria bacterium]|nr:diguanylate cyclase [Gammaproteobacteria bacterium]
MSFIRVHKPHAADKFITKGKKPLIDRVNEYHQQVTSFDSGKFGYFLRIVTPIFSKENKYLGVAEFSINISTLTQDIKNKFGYESLFLVKNTKNKVFLNSLGKTKNGLILFKSTNEELFKNFNLDKTTHTTPQNPYSIPIKNNNKSFSAISINLSDTTTLIVAFDITDIIKEQKSFEKNVTSLITLVIFIFMIIWIIATNLYIKNKQQISSQLQKSHDIISENVIFSTTDLDGIIIEVSDAFCLVSGYKKEKILGFTHKLIQHPDMDESTYKNILQILKSNKTWKGEIKNLTPDGDIYWVNTTISPRFNENNKKICYMLIMQNITDRKTIEAISITDGLCGINNRRYFDDIFPRIINSAKRNNEQVCFLIMDVDYFKQYNDIYGHQKGDNVLKNISRSLKESLQRGDDYCFRLGGEEFGIIFKAENKQLALDFANTIRINIENLKIPHSNSDVSKYVTASFGVVCKNAGDIKNTDEIYKDTDDLLYKAKDSGRNIVFINM